MADGEAAIFADRDIGAVSVGVAVAENVIKERRAGDVDITLYDGEAPVFARVGEVVGEGGVDDVDALVRGVET